MCYINKVAVFEKRNKSLEKSAVTTSECPLKTEQRSVLIELLAKQFLEA